MAATTALVAGLLHVFVAVEGLLNPALTEMFYGKDTTLLIPGFFLVLGGSQLTWTWVTLKYSDAWIGIGLVGFLGSIILYLVSLVTPLPFGVMQQSLSRQETIVPAITKIFEATYVVSSLKVLKFLHSS